MKELKTMNREIKFRALTTKGFIYSDEMNMSSFWARVERDNLKANEFTGLKDKNGKEIYEGDIVRNHRYDDVAEVIWSNDTISQSGIVKSKFFGETIETDLNGFFTSLGEFRLKSKNNRAYHIQDTEVIGNIYENPELLKN